MKAACNHGYRRVILNVSAYSPKLDAGGGLELTVPTHEGPMFTPEYIEYLKDQHGAGVTDQMLDEASYRLLQQDLVRMLSKDS